MTLVQSDSDSISLKLALTQLLTSHLSQMLSQLVLSYTVKVLSAGKHTTLISWSIEAEHTPFHYATAEDSRLKGL